MVTGIFTTNFTISEILVIQQRAKEFFDEGKTLMSWNESGSSATKQFILPPDRVLEECKYALRVLDPATFGRRRTVDVSQVSGYLPK